MQKPVATLAADDRVAKANTRNLRSALAAALLLLPVRSASANLCVALCSRPAWGTLACIALGAAVPSINGQISGLLGYGRAAFRAHVGAPNPCRPTRVCGLRLCCLGFAGEVL